MAIATRELRIPEELGREIDRETTGDGARWSETAIELLEEAVRMRRVPGIAFMGGPTGRRATVGGTGLDVWEVVRTWKQDVDEDYGQLRSVYDWLNEFQLRAALSYYEQYPEEIDERLDIEESLTPERIYAEYPFMRPPWR